jgi:hypothetical protein
MAAMASGAVPEEIKKPKPILGAISITDGVMCTTQSLDELFSDHDDAKSRVLNAGRI